MLEAPRVSIEQIEAIASVLANNDREMASIPLATLIAERLASMNAGAPLDDRTFWMLSIIEAMGGSSDASDNDGWISAFCDDLEGDASDTFNRAADAGYITVSHDPDMDASTARLTDAGRAALVSQKASTSVTAHKSQGLPFDASLVRALDGLEAANEGLAAVRSDATYLSMVDVDKASDQLNRLDEARRIARAVLEGKRMGGRYITLWRKTGEQSLEWDWYVSEDLEEAERCVTNLLKQDVIQYSTYPLGVQIPDLTVDFSRKAQPEGTQ